ncbi:MAG TPA: FHA domain-containing serine/threonine-protein kinase [Puia sp.]|jgi:serine/threonine protein kinase|nr:FHA domain-containing serine/threonine-protein kinase [Puia sp.]
MNIHPQQTAVLFGSYETPRRFVAAKGDIIEGYTVLDQLGEGTFGAVYKVRSPEGVTLALKVIKLWEIAFEKERRAIISRFVREFEIASTPSQYLVKSYGYGKIQGNPYITMDYCAGGSLGTWVGKFGRHPRFNHIAYQVLLGLRELHSKGYFHRDIKPQNILLKDNNTALLTDFGIAGQKNNRLTVTNIFGRVEQIFGTWAYLAPEQANNKVAFKALDAVTDIFSFGVMMFELFTGQYPFPPYKIDSEQDLVDYLENTKKGLYTNIDRQRHLLPDPWTTILRACLEPDYQHKRINNVDSILQMLGHTPDKETILPYYPASSTLGLQVTYGEDMHRVYNLNRLLQAAGHQILTLGRKDPSVNNHIEITENQTTFISRRHGTIERWTDPACWIIRDGQWTGSEWKVSMNHAYLNSRRIDQGGARIKPGDIITLGDTVLKVILINDPSENQLITG